MKDYNIVEKQKVINAVAHMLGRSISTNDGINEKDVKQCLHLMSSSAMVDLINNLSSEEVNIWAKQDRSGKQNTIEIGFKVYITTDRLNDVNAKIWNRKHRLKDCYNISGVNVDTDFLTDGENALDGFVEQINSILEMFEHIRSSINYSILKKKNDKYLPKQISDKKSKG